MDSLGSRIKEIRKSQKMTQTDFGNLFGLSPSHISNIEMVERTPRLHSFSLSAPSLILIKNG